MTMFGFKKLIKDWNSLFESSEPEFPPRSLRVLDFDHTVAFTGEKVYVMSPEGEVVDTLTSDEYSHHNFFLRWRAMVLGYHYDFREFDDVDISLAKENPHVTSILRNFINAGPERIILILTARNQEAESGIRNYLDSIGIDSSNLKVVGVGSSEPQKKVDVVKQMLEKYGTIDKVSFFDDSMANTEEMKKILIFRMMMGETLIMMLPKLKRTEN